MKTELKESGAGVLLLQDAKSKNYQGKHGIRFHIGIVGQSNI